MKALGMIVACLAAWPLLCVGWLAGFVWTGLACGFWHGARYIESYEPVKKRPFS